MGGALNRLAGADCNGGFDDDHDARRCPAPELGGIELAGSRSPAGEDTGVDEHGIEVTAEGTERRRSPVCGEHGGRDRVGGGKGGGGAGKLDMGRVTTGFKLSPR